MQQYEDFNNLQVGDVIWVNRYDTEEEKKQIPVGHRVGPAIIIKKNKRTTCVLHCTSNSKHYNKTTKKRYCLGKKSYSFSKNSYVIMTRICKIKKAHFLSKITSLSEHDLNQIKKNLTIINIKSQCSLIKDMDLRYKLSEGDTVKFENEEYYIYKIDNKYYHLYKMMKNKTRKEKIYVNEKFYSFDISKYKRVSIRRRLPIMNTFSPLEINTIENHLKSLLKIAPKPGIIPKSLPGDIIKYRDRLYLILKVQPDELKALKIREIDKQSNCKTPKFKIASSLYTTDFVLVTLKKAKYEHKGSALKNQYRHIEHFIDQMPKKLKSSKRSFPSMDIEEFTPRNVIYNTMNKTYYLIIKRESNVVELVNIDKIYDTFEYEISKENPFQLSEKFDETEFENFMIKINKLKELASSLGMTT